MNWYVKFEGTGVISGPMSHEKAEYYAEAAVGLVFSEAVFEQEEVVNFPSKVEDLLKDLHLHLMPLSVGKDYNLDNRLSSLCQRAIDTITNLSRDQKEEFRAGIRAAASFAGEFDQQIFGTRHKFEDVILGKFNLVPENEMRDKKSQSIPVDFSVAVLVSELQGLREAKEIIRQGEDDAIGKMLKCVMDALIHLSREKVVTPEAQEELLEALGYLSTRTDDCRDCGGFNSEDRELCQRAIDTIVLLSRKKTETFLVDKETTALINGLLEIDRDSHICEKQVELFQSAANMLVLLRIPKVVRGTIQGGVLSLEDVPAGVTVDIKDYDCEGVDEENLNKDETGTHFQAG